MTRGKFRAAAVVLVVLVIAGLGWLFLAPRSVPVAGERGEVPVERPAEESGEDAEARSAASPRSAPAGAAGSVDAEAPEEEGRPGPESKKVSGVCVLEDGTPLAGAGVSISPPDPLLGREDDKDLGAWEGTTTAEDGRFEFVPGSKVRANHPFARAVAVEGGVAEIEDRDAFVRTGAENRGLRILFRDDPGMAHVRLVDSSTEEPLTSVQGLRLTYLFGRELSGRVVYDHPKDTGFGGWISIREGSLPENLPIQADPAGVVVEFAALGFAAKRVPFQEIRGRMTVRVDPVPPCAVGAILLYPTGRPQPMGPTPSVLALIHRAEGDLGPPAAEVRGLPTDDGPFLLYDLPQGSWVLVVAADLGGSLMGAKRAFEYRGIAVDLGDLLLQRRAAVRARVLDAEGSPIPQARVVVVREGEDPEKAQVLAPYVDGWVECADLEPGASHRAVVLGMPRPLERAVTTSPDGSRVEVELSWPDKLVPCRITLVVDGKAVANPDGSRMIPATVNESPVPRNVGKWNTDGTFATKLVPGTYRFSVYATPEGGGDLVLFGGEVTVPSGDSFETRLELRRETR